MTEDEVRARFLDARVARLATADVHGVPHIVPIVFAIDGDRIVTAIDGKPKKKVVLRRIGNIEANSSVSVLVDHYDENWSHLWWARADGHARLVGASTDADAALSLLRRRYPQYATVALTGPAIVIDVEHWSGWSARLAE